MSMHASKTTFAHTTRAVFALAVLGTLSVCVEPVRAQGIDAVSPGTGVQGSVNLMVMMTLSSDPSPPPIDAPLLGAMIGSLEGESLLRVDEYNVSAAFMIPADEPLGAKDVSVEFGGPEGSVVFSSMTDGFTVTAAPDAPPTVVLQPEPQRAAEGDAVFFSVAATGTTPFSYQWQKDRADLTSATASTLELPSVTPDDAGAYRCVVANALGTTTSEEAVLTVITAAPGCYPVVDTGQMLCYDASTTISAPAPGEAFYGQDAQYNGNTPSYVLSADALTVFDAVTSLTWQSSADTDRDGDIDAADKLTWTEAQAWPAALNDENYGGFSDWRLPTIKELYSLILFWGKDPSIESVEDNSGLTPFIDTNYFEFAYGDTASGERIIDAQYASNTMYVSTEADEMLFGVNFADGRIKGYGLQMFGADKTFCVLCVRGPANYGVNRFIDNDNGTVTDEATGLMWMQGDSGDGLNWEEALDYAESSDHAGYQDWRLPNAKELQSIVDYTRSPATHGTAAINPIFNCTHITNEAGQADFPFYWSSTTHASTDGTGSAGAYVAFGRAMGYMGDAWGDEHGAGAQRSDPKEGDPDDFPYGRGPQGDAIRIYNHVRLVRDARAPEIVVQDGAINLDDYASTVSFGQTQVGAPVERIFTVCNTGTDELTLTPPISAPAGFGVTSGFASNRLAPGASTSFTLQLTAATPGDYSGAISLLNNDPDESPFEFFVTGTVSDDAPPTDMTIEQTLSDGAQRNTIAFDGLAFLTGSLGADSFLPPGKVADFWGFQFLRDNDPSNMGHNTDFLTRAANNMLYVLTDSQIEELVVLAENQVDDINQYAYDRFVLMKAFRRLLENDLPPGATGLNPRAVEEYSAELYWLDGEMSYERAEVMGGILSALDEDQRAWLDAMVGQGMASWPDVGDQLDPQDYTHDVHVAIMTYAGDLFSWYGGSLEADVYFCPERQGTYFGSFYLKDAPAMGNPDYTIDENITADYGEAFLAALSEEQAARIAGLVDVQREDLYEIVEVRERVASQLRRFLANDVPDRDAVLALMDAYGELDGRIVHAYASAFAEVGQSLTEAQGEAIGNLRGDLGVSQPVGAYLYSEPIALPEIPNTDFLFLGNTAASFWEAYR